MKVKKQPTAALEAKPEVKPEEVKPETGTLQGNKLPDFSMPEKLKKPRKPRTSKPKIDALVDFKLPMAALAITLTDALSANLKNRGMDAKRADCWRMSDSEAEQFEAAFNTWVTVRAPLLEKWYPEIALAMSLSNYAVRAVSGIAPDITE